MIDAITAYPLAWPNYRPRTEYWKIADSKFDKRRTFAVIRDELVREVERMGGRELILSTNVPVRQDGLPYASFARPKDMGVAVYFKRRGKSLVFACDQWRRIEDNMQAIVKTIDALRGIERWGSGEMMEQAFAGFAALPPPDPNGQWWVVLGVDRGAHIDDITLAYRRLRSAARAKENNEEFNRIQRAYDLAQQEKK